METEKGMERRPLGRPSGMKAEFSKWDTDLFGYKIGILKCKENPAIQEVRKDNQDLDVVFIKVDQWVDPNESMVALDHLYDMELVFSPKLGWWPNRNVEHLKKPSNSHLKLAKHAFTDSRFLRDGKLADKAPEIYGRWLTEGGDLYTLPHPEQDTAFVLVGKDEPKTLRISLVAVDGRHRKSGKGRSLVLGVIEKFHPEINTWHVKVAARNINAIRFYEDLGFRVKKAMTAFHVWIDKEERGL